MTTRNRTQMLADLVNMYRVHLDRWTAHRSDEYATGGERWSFDPQECAARQVEAHNKMGNPIGLGAPRIRLSTLTREANEAVDVAEALHKDACEAVASAYEAVEAGAGSRGSVRRLSALERATEARDDLERLARRARRAAEACERHASRGEHKRAARALERANEAAEEAESVGAPKGRGRPSAGFDASADRCQRFYALAKQRGGRLFAAAVPDAVATQGEADGIWLRVGSDLVLV